jgi:hypothetical protein
MTRQENFDIKSNAMKALYRNKFTKAEIIVRENQIYMFDPRSKKKKFNTPLKGIEVAQALDFESEEVGQDKDSASSCYLDAAVRVMSELLPEVLHNLEAKGQLKLI